MTIRNIEQELLVRILKKGLTKYYKRGYFI